MVPFVVLFSWPLVVFFLVSRYRLELALPIAIIAGFLLLPVQTFLDLPLVPTLDKNNIPAIGAILAVAMISTRKISHRPNAGIFIKHPVGTVVFILLVASPFLSGMTNGQPLQYGPLYVPGVSLKDSVSFLLVTTLKILPLLLAYKFLGHPDGQKALLWVIIISALLYSFLALFEIRFSPMLSRLVYGIQSVLWLQHIRGSGFRPLVFLQHGLLLSQFLSFGVLAAVGASTFMGPKYRAKLLIAAGFLFVTLILSKSLGSLMLTIILAPIIIFFSPRVQMLVAAALAAAVFTYPILRSSDMVPTEGILAFVESIDVQRADSLAYRFRNEDILLAKAEEKPFLGWSGYGRARVYNSDGQDISVTDGYWVIIFGNGGWLLYLAEMGLLCFPIIYLSLRYRRLDLGRETSVITVIFASILVDLIPNAGATPVMWLMCGTLWGRLVMGEIQTDMDPNKLEATSSKKMVLSYSRSSKGYTDPQGGSAYARPYQPKVRR